MAAKTITVSVISDLTTDQRVIRICSTLQKMGFNIFVIARSFRDSLPLENYPFQAARINCFFRKGIMQYAEFNCKLFIKLLFCRTDYFLANDLDVLIPNYAISKMKNKFLFYDSHEYFTGVPELRNSNGKRKIWKFFEDCIFPKLKVVYTVNDSVKNKYFEEYGNQIGVVRNVPVTKQSEAFMLPARWENKTLLLLQGAGINEGRGGLELLEAMKILPDHYFLLLIGSGTQWNTIKQKRIDWYLENKVEMMEKLPPSELQKLTALAHIGFSLDSFEDLNCLYNLPNKVFDYMHAGVPIIATAIPEVKILLDKYKCGISIDSNDAHTIAAAVHNMMNDKKTYEIFKLNCTKAAKELCWENESKKIETIYQPYL